VEPGAVSVALFLLASLAMMLCVRSCSAVTTCCPSRGAVERDATRTLGALGVRSVTVLPRPASPKKVGSARSEASGSPRPEGR
jgi:hypothetical protein